MTRSTLTFVLIILIFVTFTQSVIGKESILIYSAAGLINPMEEIADQFKKEYGIELHLQFNGSGVLKNQIETVKKGDIYIAADSWYLKDLYNKDIVHNYYNIAQHIPVIITPKNNGIVTNHFDDLLNKNLKIIVADPSAAIGRVTEEIIRKNKLGDNFRNNIISKAETVNKVRMYIIMGQADAGIVWKANYFESKDKLKLIKIPQEQNIIKNISIGLLRFSNNRKHALKFIDYMQGEKAAQIFENHGYDLNLEKVK